MREERKSNVEEAIKLFIDLDKELDVINSEVERWGAGLIDHARKLGEKIRLEVLDEARREGERLVEEHRRRAEEEAARIISEGEGRSKELLDRIESIKDKLVKEIIKLVMPA